MSTDFLSSMVKKFEQTQADIDKKSSCEKVLMMDPNEIGNWEYRDRQYFELGNIEDLADSIELKGQAQPIIIVKASSVFKTFEKTNCPYIVIAGYRRWLACKSRKLEIDAIVRNMNMEQAIACLVSENEKEKVSDYSKGMFYFNLLQKEGITKKALFEKLGIKKGVFDNYISFAEVPNEIWEAVGDLSNVSARTSSTIKLLSQKGEAYKNALLSISSKIAEGIGEKKITSLVHKELSKENYKKEALFKNATRVAFSDFVYMESKKNQIKLDLNISKDKFELLKIQISLLLENFIQSAHTD
jgi:ParB family chromosome partitioning protein